MAIVKDIPTTELDAAEMLLGLPKNEQMRRAVNRILDEIRDAPPGHIIAVKWNVESGVKDITFSLKAMRRIGQDGYGQE